jgi:hypothetical protein
MRAANVAMLVGGLAAGAVIGSRVVAGSEQGSSSKAWMIGGGAAAGVAGTAGAWLAYHTAGSATSAALKGANLLGVGLMAAGVGAAIAGALTKQKAPVAPAPTPTPTPTPNEPAPPTAGSRGASAIMGAFEQDSWMTANTAVGERSLLAAGAAKVNADAAGASRVLQDLSKDEWVGATYSPLERVGLAIAGLEAGRTGEQVATTQVNVDGAVDTAGQPATGDLESTADRSMLAQAAIRGAVDGETAAYVYAGIRNHDVEGIDPHQAARLASAALEGGASLEEAIAAIEEVKAHPATSGLPKADQVTLASGAARARTSGTQAAQDYATVAGDQDIAPILESGDLTTDQAARLAAAATVRQLSGEDAALTFVNALADDAVWETAEDYEQVIDLSIGALEGKRTGAEAASAFRTINSGVSTRSLPASTKFELAAAAIAGDGATSVVNAYKQSSTDSAFTNGTNAVQDALLATGRGFDATSDSELLDWYVNAQAAS